MPTKPLERLIFTQGGNCFFCRKPLGKAEASVGHLVAVSHGGKDNDENCVACCKALNSLFGRMSLKEKLQIVLNQKGVLPAQHPIRPWLPNRDRSLIQQERGARMPRDLHRSSRTFRSEEMLARAQWRNC
jgi:5-methylcytosine-specific restriction endonuclease McrA